MYVARFAEAANVLIRGGIPVTQAIEISSHTVGNAIYREALHEAAEGIRRGELLSALLERGEELFPPMVSQMVAVGESTGKLDEMLDRMAGFFTREVDDSVSGLGGAIHGFNGCDRRFNHLFRLYLPIYNPVVF